MDVCAWANAIAIAIAKVFRLPGMFAQLNYRPFICTNLNQDDSLHLIQQVNADVSIT